MIVAAKVEACDAAAVKVIVEGRYTESLRAIGTANVPTLHAAAQACAEALPKARGAGEPWKQFHSRGLLCRSRITRINEERKASF